MNIAIIIHSNTGHTLEVANDLKLRLSRDNDVQILHVNSVDEKQSQKGMVELKDTPDIEGFDMIIFGAPVHGFSLSKTMTTYLKQLKNSKPKKAFIYVTHFFPSAGLGGRQGLRVMLKYLKNNQFDVINGAIIPWSFGKRKAIKNFLNEFKLENEEKRL